MKNSAQSPLEINRQGRLDSSQFIQFIFPIALAAVWLLIAAIILGAEIYMWMNHMFNGQRILGTVIMPVGILLCLLVAALTGGNQVLDLLAGQVKHIEGSSRKQVGTGTRGARVQRYFVGEFRFIVSSGKTFAALPENNIVRSYYTPRSKTLVNAEILKPGG
jgi:hypothetical protein